MYGTSVSKIESNQFSLFLHIIDSLTSKTWWERRKIFCNLPLLRNSHRRCAKEKSHLEFNDLDLLNAARVITTCTLTCLLLPCRGTTLSPVATSPWPIVPDVNYGGQSPKFRAGFLVVVALSRTCACSWTRKHLRGKDYAREFGRPPLSTPNITTKHGARTHPETPKIISRGGMKMNF